MKKVLAVCIALGFGSLTAFAEVAPEEVIEAIDQMSPEQVDELYTKLYSSYWDPIPEGFFTRLGVRVDLTTSQVDDLKLEGLGLSDPSLDVDALYGAEFAFLWQVAVPEFGIGFRIGSQATRESSSEPSGYSRLDLYDGNMALIANYQLVRKQSVIVWAEGGVGGGWVGVETLNTPTGSASTIRELDGAYGMADARLGISWRFNPILSLHAGAGYRFAQSVDLEEGDEDTQLEADMSGFIANFGIGFSL